MVTDPVCGMAVDEKKAAGTAVHAGQAYYFCSMQCLEKFRADPQAYVENKAVPLKMAVGQGHVHTPGMAAAAPKGKVSMDMAKDPICGMVVANAKALKTDRPGRA